MNAALILLLKLRARGAWRKFARTVRRPKGALLFAIVLVFFGMVVLPNLLIERPKSIQFDSLWLLRPEALFAVWLLFAVTARNTTAIAFSLPEVEFLFPGPFSRRELLAYKLIVVSLGPLGTAMMMPLFLWQSNFWWPALAIGVWATLMFMQTTSLLLNLAINWLAAVRGRWRVAIIATVVPALALAVGQARAALRADMNWTERLATLDQVWLAQVLLAPFEAFSHLMRAQSVGTFAAWGGIALGTNAAVIALVMWMDANFLEVSLAISQRRYAWIERARRSGGMPSFGMRSKPRLSLPSFPRLAGAGPVAWRQALELLRTSTRLVFALPAVFAAATPALLSGPQGLTASIIILTVMISFLISTVMPMGLRTDLEHVETLKSLPISADAIVWGSIAPAVLYPAVIQCLAVALLSAIGGQWSLASTLVVCFALPANLLLVAADSVLVLLYPSTRRFSPGDFLVAARMMLTYTVKVLFLGVAAIVPVMYVLVVQLVVGQAVALMAAGVWLALVVEGAATVWLAAILFARIDPSIDEAAEQ